ncbi:UbiA prenyltransferase family-domain-containing protein [Aspergillus pseudotamarii]|uniref:UbiA prenyltransferase family-domain-containing protein n=1 Tax=Aspergillus pseudotamarii TaxID=132259 RepID=A0A5N6T0J7_ASPPS|nr:UbiA prenyltransferase family-domain-containing protein [Aspergillus pseudotamarii]KAE8139064.1 UbiA prenyltransferase family-domain-containing protein [Aspergillus pseudotamarii]
MEKIFKMASDKPTYAIRTVISALLEEAALTRALLDDNSTAHIGNAIVCLSTRLIGLDLTLEQLKTMLPGMFLTTFTFAYTFDIANQTFSVEEDTINKPNRPIPSGRLSMNGAYTRWLISWVISLAIIGLTVSHQAALVLLQWEVWVSLFYVWPKFQNWVARNLFTAVGATIQLRLLDAVLVKTIPSFRADSSLTWLLFIWLAWTIHVQEFHDTEGDQRVGRQTLPLIVGRRGQFPLRVVTAMIIGGTGISSIVLAQLWRTPNPAMLYLALAHLLFMLTVAVRLVVLPFKEADKVTYKYYYTLATYSLLLFRQHTERLGSFGGNAVELG